MVSPLKKTESWITEEREMGNIFPEGAVLSTISKDRTPRARVVGTLLDNMQEPMFFTSPTTRKYAELQSNNHVSLTYSFHNTLRSINLEGTVKELTSSELDIAWLLFDEDFRKHYFVFGYQSGKKLESMESLRQERDKSTHRNLSMRPDFFIGYKFDQIERISFYSVQENDFALYEVYDWDAIKNIWSNTLLVP